MPIELASTTVVSIAAGFHHTCAVTAQGALLCFGDNSTLDMRCRTFYKERFLERSI